MGLIEVLTKAMSFVVIILIGFILRRANFFKESDFHVLYKIVLKITLPAAIITSFANKEIDASLLVISLLGFGGAFLCMACGYLVNIRSTRERKAFAMVNTSGYNIGNFTLPFAQSFLGPAGVVCTSLFDTGNALVCLGLSFSLASMVQGGGQKISLKKIAKTLAKSIPFVTYIVMTALALLHIHIPAAVTEVSGVIGGSNAFLAMLMIGVGFKLSGDREQVGRIVQILTVRYGLAAILALCFYFLLPFQLEYRQALVLLSFSPISSAAPAFTADLKNDFGLASAVNSISILISIVCMVCLLLIIM